MSGHYSDDLYSGEDTEYYEDANVADEPVTLPQAQETNQAEDDLAEHLSPTDGYFRASDHAASSSPFPSTDPLHVHENIESHTSSSITSRADPDFATFSEPSSANVPRVPNVLVEDPSLERGSTAESKAREAREEQRRNDAALLNSGAEDSLYRPQLPSLDSTATPTTSTASAPYTPSTSAYQTSVPSHVRTFSEDSNASSVTARNTPTTTTSPVRSPVSPRRTLFSGRTDFFGLPAEAPPAYTPSSPPNSAAPISEDLPQQQQQQHEHPFRGYNTFENHSFIPAAAMGVPDESRHLLSHQPQHMGDRPYDEENINNSNNNATPHWMGRTPRWMQQKRVPSRNLIKKVLWVALLLAIISTITSVTANIIWVVQKHQDKGNDVPDNDHQPNTDDPGRMPVEKMPWNPGHLCKRSENRQHYEPFAVNFADWRPLMIEQKQVRDDLETGWQPSVWGDIILRRQEDETKPSVEVEVITNDKDIDVRVIWDLEKQHLLVETPMRVRWAETLRPCVQLRITVWVPDESDAALRSLVVSALQLDVRVADNLALRVADVVRIGTVSGVLRGAADGGSPGRPAAPESFRLDCRDIAVGTVSGTISGWWPLYDSLKIESVSGDVKVGVGPQPISESSPKKAVLTVASVSGTLSVSEPILDAADAGTKGNNTKLPARDYDVNLTTKSGGIRAWLAFSTQLRAESISGNMWLRLQPVLNATHVSESDQSLMDTQTRSGDMDIEVLEPLWVDIAPTASERRPVRDPCRDPNVPDLPDLPNLPDLPDIPYEPIGEQDPYNSVLPHLDDDHANTNELVRVAGRPPLVGLAAKHESISGDVRLRYPASWEGTVNAMTVSGDVNLRGEGLSVTRSGGSLGKRYRGRKGKYGSDIGVETISGDMDVLIGTEPQKKKKKN